MSRLITAGLMVLVALGGSGLRAQDEPVWKDIKRGPWKNPKHIPDGFTKKTVGRYEIQSNCDEETLEIVATHLNAMYSDGFKEFLRPSRTPSDKMVLKLLQDERQFLAYGQAYGAAAYFSPSDREMVGYDTGVLGGIVRSKKAETGQGAAKDLQRWMDRNEMDLLGVMSHEAWHQYFHWCCSSIVDFPAWCDEGISEYFYSCWVGDDKKLVLGSPNDVRLETAQALAARDRYVPFGTFVQYVQAEYYANPGANYAQGWAFTHFLMEHPDYKGKNYVSKFVKIFIDQHSVEKTVPRVFGKKPDWEKMEADWKEWVLSIPRRADPLSPFIEETLAFNKKADERRAKLPPKVRKALEDCLARRAPAPWEGKDGAPAAKAPAEKPAEGAEAPVGTAPEEKGDGSK